MPALTPQQYEAIGRLTLAFNGIEYWLESYMPYLVGVPELSVGYLMLEEGTFGRKADRFRSIIQAMGKDRPVCSNRVQALEKLLAEAKDLAQKRNEYVHALVVQDFKTKEVKLRIKGTTVQNRRKDCGPCCKRGP